MRVYFPDRWVLQGCFRPQESCEPPFFPLPLIDSLSILLLTVKALVTFIREHLADPRVKFHLCEFLSPPTDLRVLQTLSLDTTPPKRVLKSGRMTFAEVSSVSS